MCRKMFTILSVFMAVAVAIHTAVPLGPHEGGDLLANLPCICIVDCESGFHCAPQDHCTDPQFCRFCRCWPNEPTISTTSPEETTTPPPYGDGY